jgi:homogentisate 1,2-dioxygenase
MNKNWKTALAAMGIVPKQVKMVFEIDGANGEKLIFPDANDISEIKEGIAVTAEDGEHVFITDGKTYKIEVTSGKVAKIDITEEKEAEAEGADMQEVLQEFANEFEAKDLQITEMKATISTLQKSIEDIKALMSHGKDDLKKEEKDFFINGKKIDLSKIKNK